MHCNRILSASMGSVAQRLCAATTKRTSSCVMSQLKRGMAKARSITKPTAVQADIDNKDSALAAALQSLDKTFGKGTVMRLGDQKSAVDNVDAVSTGSLALDLALGVGGLCRGRIVEIYGAEMSGKTTLALHCIAEVQRAGGTCTFIDAEHALDPQYAKTIGVNTEDLLISQPDSGEQALEITDTLVRSGAMDMIVVDSVAALVPRAELEGEMGDAHMGLQARLMSQALRKLTANISKSRTVLIFINQIRAKIGIFAFGGNTTSGGRALQFYATMRMELRQVGKVSKGDTVIGNRVQIKIAKNKLAPPLRQVEIEVLFGKGISKEAELLDLGSLYGFVSKAGNSYRYGETLLGVGREKAKAGLAEHPELAANLTMEIKKAIVGVGEDGQAVAALPIFPESDLNVSAPIDGSDISYDGDAMANVRSAEAASSSTTIDVESTTVETETESSASSNEPASEKPTSEKPTSEDTKPKTRAKRTKKAKKNSDDDV